MKLKNRNSNAYSVIVGIVLVAMLLMGMYVIMDPFAKIYDNFTSNEKYIGYNTQESCASARGHWDSDLMICKQLADKTTDALENIRNKWLFAPLVFIVGIILWVYSQSFKKDVQQYN